MPITSLAPPRMESLLPQAALSRPPLTEAASPGTWRCQAVDSPGSAAALQCDVVDAGLELAGGVRGQLGEPDEHVTAAGRAGEVEPHEPARAGRVRDGPQIRQRGLGADAQLEAGAGGVAEVDLRAGDGDRPAHGQQQA